MKTVWLHIKPHYSFTHCTVHWERLWAAIIIIMPTNQPALPSWSSIYPIPWTTHAAYLFTLGTRFAKYTLKWIQQFFSMLSCVYNFRWANIPEWDDGRCGGWEFPISHHLMRTRRDLFLRTIVPQVSGNRTILWSYPCEWTFTDRNIN